MFYRDPEFGSRMITLMAAAALVTQFLMVGQRILITNIRLFAVQSFLLSGIAITIAWFQNAQHIYLAAALTFVLKVMLVPWFLKRIADRMRTQPEVQPLINAPVSLLLCGGLTLMAYLVAQPLTLDLKREAGFELGHNTLAVAISLLLLGFYLMVSRRKALSQVLALLTMENGVFLAAISLTYGVPFVVEIGIFFDVLVAVMVLGILVYRIGETFESMDVSKLRDLKG